MIGVAPFRPLECPEQSPLPRAKGLLDPFHIPCELPRLAEAATALPPCDRRNYSTIAILFRLLLWGLRFLFDRRFRPDRLAATGRDIATRFAAFQGFWYDLGRLLAQRNDFFPNEIREELHRYCRPSPAFTFAEVRSIVEEDLGSPIRLLFSEFDEIPVRAGMYADVYRARLRRGDVEVEVKIQRPGLEQRLKRDLKVFRFTAMVMRRVKADRHIPWDDVIDIYQERVPALLDLRYEASAMRRLRKSLKDHKVYVAKLFRRYTTKRLLIQERIEAPAVLELLALRAADPLGAAGWLETNEIDLEKSGRRLFHSMLRQICEDNYFLQDLGPSNIALLRDNRLAVISCDSPATVDKRFLTIFNLSVAALMRNDYEKFADTLFLMCDSLPVTDLSAVRADVIRAVRAYSGRSVLDAASHEEKSLFVLTSDLAMILSRNGILLDWQVLKLMGTMGSADRTVEALAPAMSYRKEMERYGKKAAGRRIRSVFSGGLTNAVGGVVSPLMEMVRFETASMRKRAQNFRASTGKVAYVFAAIVRWLTRAVIIGSVIGVWIFLHQHHFHLLAPVVDDHPASQAAQEVRHIHYGWWIVIFIAAFILYRVGRDIARRLSQREIDVEKAS
ncbi:MAG TPA: AarF/UbiB family protein [Thermoanaerobaculia bacterium]|nr:AarF/UbiB family protein [Thermoanaerobaculia bacterium]